MSTSYTMEFVVDSRDMDMYGQCRPSALLGYLQEGATLAGLELGVSGPQIKARYNTMWMVARLWVELDTPLGWNQRVELQTWHRGAAGVSSYRDFLLRREGREIGRAVSTWVMVDVDSHKLFRMKDLAEFAGTDGGELCFDKKLHRVSVPGEFDGWEERRLGYSETDINGHINNTRYADYACDALHLERCGQGKFVRSFQIGYVGECMAGETIRVDTAIRGDELYARGRGGDGGERFDFAMTLANLS